VVVTDIAGQTTAATHKVTYVVRPSDVTPPVITASDLTVDATGALTPVSFVVTAVDDVDGPVTPSCSQTSPAMLPVGSTLVTCQAADAAGNSTTETFTIKVVDTVTPGKLHGGGHVMNGVYRYDFNFSAIEHGNGENNDDDVDTNDHEFDKHMSDHKGACLSHNLFAATSVTFSRFTNDPSLLPGLNQTGVMDTVVFAGLGSWNGTHGYRFEAKATDQGEHGLIRDTFEVTITAPDGTVSALSAGR
jgi:hypothetical protein